MTKRTPEPERMAYSVKEFCRCAGIGRKLFYKLVATGEIATIKAGTRRLVPVESVKRWLAPTVAHIPNVPSRKRQETNGIKKAPKDTHFRA